MERFTSWSIPAVRSTAPVSGKAVGEPMKKFLSFLGGVLRVSTSPIVQELLPAPISGILLLASNSILAVESAMGDGNGVQKGQLVRSLMKIGLAPLVEQM